MEVKEVGEGDEGGREGREGGREEGREGGRFQKDNSTPLTHHHICLHNVWSNHWEVALYTEGFIPCKMGAIVSCTGSTHPCHRLLHSVLYQC